MQILLHITNTLQCVYMCVRERVRVIDYPTATSSAVSMSLSLEIP